MLSIHKVIPSLLGFGLLAESFMDGISSQLGTPNHIRTIAEQRPLTWSPGFETYAYSTFLITILCIQHDSSLTLRSVLCVAQGTYTSPQSHPAMHRMGEQFMYRIRRGKMFLQEIVDSRPVPWTNHPSICIASSATAHRCREEEFNGEHPKQMQRD
ncbi:uncharacterized protein BT62DRAFT_937010 [Guyanagaster necrorhizus]|uniref:Uncharacterized protein n=1 Tax=Guyanagaster necrorhizus TaxID=856835 RepID=A0A9P7VKB5_9AGAR|nr:uncharacterized protein BT62DRAFT_937010 [Guyanagaster necrorhizus MCA 3950]KAG7441494.1 hypothetical protein BT62DRAFT_937010 [Guyanagaster necrorhizus MCA 3950]